jgi:hypothetical protein
MKKYLKFIIIFCPVLSFGQAGLKPSLDKAKSFVKEIKLEKSSVSQSLTFDNASPYDLKIAVTTTDSKGKSTEEVFEFNLGLIGDVKRSASTKEMKVELNGQKGLKVIKVTKGGEMQGYEKEVVILAENVDDARELEKNLKDAIAAAKPAWESTIKLPKDDLNALQAWLSQNIKDVTSDKQTIKQSLKKSAVYKDKAVLSIEENDGKKTSESQSDFSWGDLTENSPELKINGKEISIGVKSKNDFIQTYQGSTFKGFEDKLKFYAENPTEGSVLLMAIQKIIPLAAKELKGRLPKVASKEEGFKILKDKLKDFKVNDAAYGIQIEPSCLTTYTVKSESKGKAVEEVYKFNFGDLNDFKLSVSKDLVKISSKVKEGKKYIQYTKDGQPQNYDNSIEFLLNDVENGRYLAEALPAIEKGCKTADPVTGDFKWLATQLGAVENPKQTIELKDGDKCKIKLTSSQSDSKKSVEITQELNLYDLDPKKTEIDVSGKNVGISALTLNKEKFINQTKDGKSTFVSESGFVVSNIETAKKALITFKSLIEGCKK